MTWNFDTMKEALSEMEKSDYQEFIKIIWTKMTCP